MPNDEIYTVYMQNVNNRHTRGISGALTELSGFRMYNRQGVLPLHAIGGLRYRTIKYAVFPAVFWCPGYDKLQ